MDTMANVQSFLLRSQLATRYALGIAGLRTSDVWLATFPKTGSTWLRTILFHIEEILGGTERTVDFDDLEESMPSLGRTNLLRSRPHVLPRFIKTHQPFRAGLFARPQRTMLLIRDPRDTMVSFYKMVSQRKMEQWRFTGSFSVFLRDPNHGLQRYLQHYASWKPRVNVLVRYEVLKEDGATEVLRALSALGTKVETAVVEEAVARSSFERMKAVEESRGIDRREQFDARFTFFRSGKSGGWKSTFTDEDLAYLETTLQASGFNLYH